MQEPISLQDNIVYRLGEVHNGIHKLITAILREEGQRVTPEQFTLLAALHYEEGCTQGKLAGLVNRDKTTISRVIDNMVKNGLVKRKVQSKDRRGRIITLTDKGRQIKDDLIEKTGRVYLETLTGVKPADFQATYAVLGQMMDNLERMK